MPIVLICNECVQIYNNQLYHTPDEKYMLIRVMGLGMFLIDGSKKITDKEKSQLYSKQDLKLDKDRKSFDVFKKGGLDLEQMKQIMCRIPRLPVMFEITIQTLKFVKLVWTHIIKSK